MRDNDPSHTRAFRSKEIQDRIFSFLSHQDSAHCARVCRAWTSPALNRAWTALHDLKPLLQLLAPLSQDTTSGIDSDTPTLRFSRELVSTDWDRFLFHAQLVRSLSLGHSPHTASPAGHLSESVSTELVRTCPVPYILPNLTTLNVHRIESSSRELFDRILHKDLRHLTISLVEWNDDLVDNLTASLISEMPKLVSLVIDFVNTTMDVALLSKFISKCTTLEILEIGGDGPIELSPKLMESLALLPSLRVVHKHFRKDVDTTYPSRVRSVNSWGFKKLGVANAFPRIEKLALTANLKEMSSFVSSTGAFGNLIELRINDRFSSHSRYITSLLSTLSTACPSLQYLGIEDWTRDIGQDGADRLTDERTDGPITYNSLLPIRKLSRLRVFDLTHANPVSVNDAQLIEIFGRCASLEVLNLNKRPMNVKGPALLTLGVLPLIAQQFRNVSKLGLYLDTSSAPEVTSSAPEFPGLLELDLGSTPIHDSDSVASFLCQVLPETCKLEGGAVQLNHTTSKVKSQLDRISKLEESTVREQLLHSRRAVLRRSLAAIPGNIPEERLRLSEEYKWDLAKNSLQSLRRFLQEDRGVLAMMQDGKLLREELKSQMESQEAMQDRMSSLEDELGTARLVAMDLEEEITSLKSELELMKNNLSAPGSGTIDVGILTLKKEITSTNSGMPDPRRARALALVGEMTILRSENAILKGKNRDLAEKFAALQNQLDLLEGKNADSKDAVTIGDQDRIFLKTETEESTMRLSSVSGYSTRETIGSGDTLAEHELRLRLQDQERTISMLRAHVLAAEEARNQRHTS